MLGPYAANPCFDNLSSRIRQDLIHKKNMFFFTFPNVCVTDFKSHTQGTFILVCYKVVECLSGKNFHRSCRRKLSMCPKISSYLCRDQFNAILARHLLSWASCNPSFVKPAELQLEHKKIHQSFSVRVLKFLMLQLVLECLGLHSQQLYVLCSWHNMALHRVQDAAVLKKPHSTTMSLAWRHEVHFKHRISQNLLQY